LLAELRRDRLTKIGVCRIPTDADFAPKQRLVVPDERKFAAKNRAMFGKATAYQQTIVA